MATSAGTVDDLLALLGPLGKVTAKKMFGEYCLYLDSKPVALICDDCLYVKVTPRGRAIDARVAEASPYPGAKPHLEYPIDAWRDGRHLCEVLRATFDALPTPRAKSAKPKPTKPRPTKPAAAQPTTSKRQRPKP